MMENSSCPRSIENLHLVSSGFCTYNLENWFNRWIVGLLRSGLRHLTVIEDLPTDLGPPAIFPRLYHAMSVDEEI